MTRVEELAILIKQKVKDYPLGTDIDTACDGLARAALAWMAERVPHLEENLPGMGLMVVGAHLVGNDAPPRVLAEIKGTCTHLGGRCAWEEPPDSLTLDGVRLVNEPEVTTRFLETFWGVVEATELTLELANADGALTSLMTEPSAWAMEQAGKLWIVRDNQFSQRDVAEGYDAAWRAGAEAMRQLILDQYDDEPGLHREIYLLPNPEPGEER